MNIPAVASFPSSRSINEGEALRQLYCLHMNAYYSGCVRGTCSWCGIFARLGFAVGPAYQHFGDRK